MVFWLLPAFVLARMYYLACAGGCGVCPDVWIGLWVRISCLLSWLHLRSSSSLATSSAQSVRWYVSQSVCCHKPECGGGGTLLCMFQLLAIQNVDKASPGPCLLALCGGFCGGVEYWVYCTGVLSFL